MGLFDFFRRKQPKPAAPDLVEQDLDEPRCHHYTFAHLALRSVAQEQPLAFLGVLASPDARRFLANLFQSVSEHCKEREPKPDFGIEDVAVHPVRIGHYPCAVIEMPRPRATTETFFVAAVLLADLDQGLPDSKDVKLRYFTLEKGFVIGGPPRTVLCEWTAEGSHVNYGDGPEPQLEAFTEAVREMLERKS